MCRFEMMNLKPGDTIVAMSSKAPAYASLITKKIPVKKE